MNIDSIDTGKHINADIDRLQKIEDDGVHQLLHPEEIKVRKFTGTGASLILDFSSERVKKLVQEFVAGAQKENIAVFAAGADYPMHATICDGKYPQPREKEHVSDSDIENINSQAEMNEVRGMLDSTTIMFDKVVIAPGGALLFTASNFPSSIRVARAKMGYLYGKHGLEAKKTDDILFSTGVRMSHANTEITSEQGQRYLELARSLQSEVSSNHIEVKTSSVYFGPSSQYIPK